MARENGFWGTVELTQDAARPGTIGRDVMINLRLVRYARPTSQGTQLVFGPDDHIEVAADFATVSRRLYEALDDAPDPDRRENQNQRKQEKET